MSSGIRGRSSDSICSSISIIIITTSSNNVSSINPAVNPNSKDTKQGHQGHQGHRTRTPRTPTAHFGPGQPEMRDRRLRKRLEPQSYAVGELVAVVVVVVL